jgi:hypothetical protein
MQGNVEKQQRRSFPLLTIELRGFKQTKVEAYKKKMNPSLNQIKVES